MKIRFVCYVSVLSLFLGLANTETTLAQTTEGWRALSDERILNGEKVDGVIRRVEWVLSLRKNGRHICGASLISPRFAGREGEQYITSWSSEARDSVWAVTAAHCVVERDGSPSDPKSFSVLGGIIDVSPRLNETIGEVQKVQEIYMPSEEDSVGPYNSISLQNDIALLRLSDSHKDLKLRRLSIRLPTIRDIAWIYDAYTAVYTAGWGRTEDGAASNDLLEVRLPLVDRHTCQDKFFPFGDIIYPGAICAGFTSGEYDSCQGDSGGPLYYRPTTSLGRTASPVLIGVVSWGRGCGNSDLFGVYTSIAFYEDWIRSKIEDYQN